jgi:hypothetical protein
MGKKIGLDFVTLVIGIYQTEIEIKVHHFPDNLNSWPRSHASHSDNARQRERNTPFYPPSSTTKENFNGQM